VDKRIKRYSILLQNDKWDETSSGKER